MSAGAVVAFAPVGCCPGGAHGATPMDKRPGSPAARGHAGGSRDAAREAAPHRGSAKGRTNVITLGVILLILGLLFGVNILYTIGVVLLVVGAALWILGGLGRAIGPRRHYW